MLQFINGMISIFLLPVYHCSICISLLRWIFHTNAFILYDYFRQRLPSLFKTPEEFDNTALFQFLAMVQAVRLTAHTISSRRKRSFTKTLFKPEELENGDFSFSCGWQTSSFYHPHFCIRIFSILIFPSANFHPNSARRFAPGREPGI